MKKALYWVLISFFAIIFLVCAFVIVQYMVGYFDNKQLQNELSNLHTTSPTASSSSVNIVQNSTPGGTTSPTDSTWFPSDTQSSGSINNPTEPVVTTPQILEEMRALYALNNHVVGWIYIEGTEIDYPVLQTPNTAEWQNYYLYRDFYGKDSKRGSIYVREVCDVFGPCDNVVIYGHCMNDYSMFGRLASYNSKSFYESHKYIQFDTLYERHTYEIIAIFVTSGTSGVGLTYHSVNNFKSEAEFNDFITAIKGGSSKVYTLYDIPTTAVYGDKLITLSTCNYSMEDGRLVVVAKRIS